MTAAKCETEEQRAARVIRNRAASRRWARLHPDKKQEYMRRCRYGLEPEEWEALFESQGRKCGCCGSPTPDRKKGWAVDHDHATGLVRGILCSTCNLAIGMFKDNPEKLGQAMAYLERHQPKQPSNLARSTGMQQKPTIGRVVHYCHSGLRYLAHIVCVHNDTCVNLVVFSQGGDQIDVPTSLNYAEETNHDPTRPNMINIPHGHWTWPPRS